MTKLFLDKLSQDFKDRLLDQTRKEIAEQFKDQTLTDIDRNNIEMLFVQPLYYSKLQSFLNIFILQNEISIKQVLDSNDITDTDKELFFSILSNKMGTSHTTIENDTSTILNKIFLNSENISSDLSSILKTSGKELISAKAGTNYLKFNNRWFKYTTYCFYAPMLIDAFQSDVDVQTITEVPIDKEIFNEYSKLDRNFTYKNNALLISNPSIFNEKSIDIKIDNGKTKTIVLEGYIWDVKIKLSDMNKVKVQMEDNFGFSYNKITINVDGLNNGKITWKQYYPSSALLSKIESQLKGVDVLISNPFKVDCSITVKSKEFVGYYKTNLGKYKNKNDFFEIMKGIVLNADKQKMVPVSYSAKIYVNPFVYKETYFTAFDIGLQLNKLLSSVPEEAFVFRISDVYIENTNEHYTL